jgi:hypothetical protein
VSSPAKLSYHISRPPRFSEKCGGRFLLSQRREILHTENISLQQLNLSTWRPTYSDVSTGKPETHRLSLALRELQLNDQQLNTHGGYRLLGMRR